MSLVFKTPKSALNTTTGTLQNLKSGDCPAPSLTTESVEYTENGEYSVATPEGYDGLSGVSVTVNVPSDIHNQEKTATPTTSSQEIIADSGYSGLSKVTVSAVTSSIDANIQANNIKNGVSILGVNGTYDPQPNLQNKSATSNTLYTQVTPSAGYDGMSSATISTSASSKGTASNPYISIADEGDLNTVVNPSYFTFTIPANTMINAPGTGQAQPNAWFLGFPSNYAEFANVGLDVFGTFPTGFQISVGDTIIVTSAPINPDGLASVQLYSYNGSTNTSDWVAPSMQSKSATPTTSSQTIQPDSGYAGLSQVTVGAVTSAIDRNITAENILDGVTILGVTGNVIEANLDAYSFNENMAGNYAITPTGGFNGFDEVSIFVDPNPNGSFWNSLDLGNNEMMADVYRKYDEGGYFDGMSVFFSMEVETGSIDQDGYYVAEDANGSAFYIHPYIDNPDFDPEQPEDPTTNPALIFPDDFDLSGLVVQVEAPWESVTITENIPADPREETTYTVEIDECDIAGINWNGDRETWAFGTLEIDQNGVFDPKGFAEIEVNVSGGGTQCPDWSSIGWTCNDVADSGIDADVAVTAALLENYVPALQSHPFANTAIVYAPKVSPTNNSNPGLSYTGWFANCSNLTYVPNIRFESGQISGQVTVGCENMFMNCISLKKVSLDLTDYGNGSQSNGYVGGANDMFNGCSVLTDVTLTNTNGFRDCRRMFMNCRALVNAPMFNTANVTDMSEMLENCQMLTSIPLYDTSNVTIMAAMFRANTTSWAPKFTTIPLFDTSNVTDMREMFKNNIALRTIPAIDTSNVTDVANMFSQCSSLQELPQLDFGKVTILSTSPYDGFLYGATNIATLGGFVNLGKSFTGSNTNGHRLQLGGSQLTKESLMNVINNLAAPDDTTVTDATLKLSATSYALLSASDIAIATAKNWTVTSA